MRTDVLQTVKDTLEQTKNIKVLSLFYEDNTIFGVYIVDVRESLSFLHLPLFHIETDVMGINIQFFELGAVLHHIYDKGALKFVDILTSSDENIKPDVNLLTLNDFVLQHLPFNIAKVNYIQALNKDFNYSNKNEVAYLYDILLIFVRYLNKYSEYKIQNDYQKIIIENESDFVSVCNNLYSFRQELESTFLTKFLIKI